MNLIGIECGLTRMKAVIMTPRGRTLHAVSRPTPVVTGRDRSSMDLDAFEGILLDLIGACVTGWGGDAGTIGAVGLSGHGNGLYLLDRDGRPMEGITSMDHRCQQMSGRFLAEAADDLFSLTGQTVWSGQPGMLLRWMKDHDPRAYERIGSILFCKDMASYLLTGIQATDYSDASASGLLNIHTGDWDESILDILGIPEVMDILPPLHESYQPVGAVTREATARCGLACGTVVTAGLFDVDAWAWGCGLTRRGDIVSVAGAWNLNMSLTHRITPQNSIRQTILRGDGRSRMAIDSSATSMVCLRWFEGAVWQRPLSDDDLNGLLARPREDVPLFLPFVFDGLSGDNPGGSFLGLRSHHTAEDLLVSVLYGITLAHRWHLERLVRAGLPCSRILFTGDGAGIPAWCALLAATANRPVATMASRETGILGGCIMAARGAGLCGTTDEAVDAMTAPGPVYEPDPAVGAVMDGQYRRFLDHCRSRARDDAGPGAAET